MSDATADVLTANEEFYAAFELADLDRMRAVWAGDDHGSDPADVTICCVHPGWDALHGTSRVMRSWALIFANTPYIQFFLSDTTVVVNGDLAVVSCAENILTAPGEPDGDAKVVSTNVFRRVDDRWLMTLHHGSPVIRQLAEEDPDG